LRPGKVSPRLSVPEHIKRPDYAISGIPHEEINNRSGPIEVKSKEEIDVLREVCILGTHSMRFLIQSFLIEKVGKLWIMPIV